MNDLPQRNGLEIAIIGMAGRFPGAKAVEQFWQNLRDGVESISCFTDEELLALGVNPAVLSDPNYVKAGFVLTDIEFFDAAFFGFNPREAEITDPQQRVFLECAWEALENAGYDSEAYPGPIGVYAGTSLNSYLLHLYSNRNLVGSIDRFQLAIGSDKDFLTTRVSYKLNLKGPSYTVQTACSTSLVAVHLACQSLLGGECDLALAGGVSISLQRRAGYVYKEGGILSPDGHCRAFDAKAQGTIGGDGVGIVVLKRLEEAIADGDWIHAVIKGSAINNDGSLKVGYTAPSIEGQAKVIRAAQLVAEVEPKTISYVEAHGTGTSLGDPIEIAALTQAFRTHTQNQGFCALGSVKTNIGHLDTAAGVAGLIKTVLALQHQQLPPSLHFEVPNPQIDFANSPFYVNTTLSEWKTNGSPRRAGVSSFGIGGTNAHVILQEAPVVPPSSPSRPWQLLVLSAKAPSALETTTTNLAAYLVQHPDLNLADVAYTLQVGRRAFEQRRMLVCQDLQDAVKALQSLDPQRVVTHSQQSAHPSVVFMFPGQGAQHANMGRELYQTEPIFQEQMDRCCELLQPHLGLDLRQVLYPAPAQVETARQRLTQTAITQPALFVIEYALAQLWAAWGIRPQAMIGHSIGEYVAACLAGVFSLEDALALVALRGRLMQQLPAGAMLTVSLPQEEIIPLLSEEVSLAASNAPSLCVVSGPLEAVDVLQNHLTEQGINSRRLHTSHAFHSQMMEPIIQPFIEQLGKVKLHRPTIPFVSNVTGTWITAAEATEPSYWARHLRQTVRFNEGIVELLKRPAQILLEVGPGRTLSTFAKQHRTEEPVLTSMRHPQEQQSDVAFLLNTLGRLWLAGVPVDWSGFYAQERRQRLPLPTYPFERQKYWIESQKQASEERQFQQESIAPRMWKSLVEAGQVYAHNGISEFTSLTYLAKKEWLDRLCTAYMSLGLSRLGAFSDSSKKYSVEELVEQFHILPRYQQLLSRWLQVLVEQGKLQQDGETFTNFIPVTSDSLNDLVKEVKIRWVDAPQWVNRAQHCGENLAVVLTGAKEPLELFVDLAAKRAANSDQGLFLDTYYKTILQVILQQVVKLLPPEVNLRILEIGGGNGVATAALLPVLSLKQTSYTFTDVGRFFLDRAQQKFSAYPFVQYRSLNIEQSPQEQGYESHSFDVVIAVNMLHVTRNVDETLQHVRSLLAPEGLFLIWEITQPQLDFDVTDGLLMQPLADRERNQGNPFLSKTQWQEALYSHGFVEVAAFPETEALGQHVLVAQASTAATSSAPTAFTTLVEQKDKDVDQTLQVSLDEQPEIADWFYLPSWQRSMPPQPFKPKIQTGHWLVFVDECGLGSQIVKCLELSGEDVITVRVGEQFGRESDRLYTLNPQHPNDYHTLLKALLAQDQLPERIVHLWSVTPNTSTEPSTELLEKSQHLGFYSLIFLAQALGEQSLTNSLQVEVVSNHMQPVTGSDVVRPEKATVLGPCHVIPQEYPRITCRSIDVDLPESGTWQEAHLIERLLAEFTANSSDQVLAYRGPYRWVQTFEPVHLDKAIDGTPRLRERGTYLITGGLGGIGLVLADYLAQTVQANLILTGRSTFPNRDEWEQWLAKHEEQVDVSQKIRKLKAMEDLGAAVLVVSADVTNQKQMEMAIAQARHRFGHIHGVIHTAAVPGGGMIQLQTPEAAASALAPKVQGTLVLNAALQDAKLDFFVLCSSLNSFLGTPGFVDYCAENTFLDAFAHYKTSRDGSLTLSINWDRWHNLGMAVAVEARHQALTGEELAAGMTPEEGIEAFRQILSNSPVPQIIVSTQNLLARIKQNHTVKSLEDRLAQVNLSKPTHQRPNLGNAYVAPRNEVERAVADIWQQLLGIAQVGVHDNFFDLGGDSLFATQLVSRLCKTFQIELPFKHFFDAPTVAELAAVVVQRLAEQADDQALAHILTDIEQLSEDEVQAMLALQEQLVEAGNSNE